MAESLNEVRQAPPKISATRLLFFALRKIVVNLHILSVSVVAGTAVLAATAFLSSASPITARRGGARFDLVGGLLPYQIDWDIYLAVTSLLSLAVFAIWARITLLPKHDALRVDRQTAIRQAPHLILWGAVLVLGMMIVRFVLFGIVLGLISLILAAWVGFVQSGSVLIFILGAYVGFPILLWMASASFVFLARPIMIVTVIGTTFSESAPKTFKKTGIYATGMAVLIVLAIEATVLGEIAYDVNNPVYLELVRGFAIVLAAAFSGIIIAESFRRVELQRIYDHEDKATDK